jgi:MinD-like ATPase involved in chromosome partitioning or flagellar assembly/Tfp pilus assembly protein PilF
MHTFWVTFYSYKGGVGRSMALANVAASLAQSGRRVLMIDFDLEAPGLDSFEEFTVPKGRTGVVEYVCHYLETGQVAPITEYVHEIHPVNPADPTKPKPQPLEGKLWLMTSGAKDDSYNRKRLSIDWAELYDRHSGAEFIENFKAEIEDTYRPDYVLVDSRTGLTDVGGVCTLHLPDLVVLLFALNEQNLQGISSVGRVLRDSEKSPQIIPVATPVPNLSGDREAMVEQRLERAKELLGTEVKHVLPYSFMVALKERILVWDEPRHSILSHRYGEVADALREANPDGLDFLQRGIREALEGFDLERAEEIGRLLKQDYPDRADSWLALADLAKGKGQPEATEQALFRALEINPNNATAYRRIEALLKNKKRHSELLPLLNRRIEAAESFGTEPLRQMLDDRAELLMRLGKPAEALVDYKRSFELEKDEDEPETLATLFNLAEAGRRATGKLNREDWKPVVKAFEDAIAGVSSKPASGRANQTQAMHIAYACIGNLDKALALLDETRKVLQQASPQERVFCVADYDHLPLKEFLQINDEMKDALARGELWDGMKLT